MRGESQISSHADRDLTTPAKSRAAEVMMLVFASILWSISGVAVKTLAIPMLAFMLYRSLGAVTAVTAGALSAFQLASRPLSRSLEQQVPTLMFFEKVAAGFAVALSMMAGCPKRPPT